MLHKLVMSSLMAALFFGIAPTWASHEIKDDSNEFFLNTQVLSDDIVSTSDLRSLLGKWVEAFVGKFEVEVAEYNMFTQVPSEAEAFAELINSALQDSRLTYEKKVILIETLVDFVVRYGQVQDRVGFMEGYNAQGATIPFSAQNFDKWFSSFGELAQLKEFEIPLRDASIKLTRYMGNLLLLGYYFHKERAHRNGFLNTISNEWDVAETKRSISLIRGTFQLADIFNSPTMILSIYEFIGSDFQYPEDLPLEASTLYYTIERSLHYIELNFPTAYGEYVMKRLTDGKPVLAIPAPDVGEKVAQRTRTQCMSLLDSLDKETRHFNGTEP